VIGRKVLSFSVGLAASALFLWIAFRSVDMQSVKDSLKSVDLGWLCISFVFFFAGYISRILRWFLMLSKSNAVVSPLKCAVVFMVSIAANNVLPLRAGDLLRTFAFSSWLQVRTPQILATVLLERILDLFVVLLFLSVTVLVFSPGFITMNIDGGIIGLPLLAIAVAILLLFFFPTLIEDWTQRILKLLQPRLLLFYTRAAEAVTKFFSALTNLLDIRSVVTLLAWSLVVWFFEGMFFYFVALSIPAVSEPVAAWLAMPMGTLSTLLPSAPGYVGTFHYFVSLAAESLGNPTIAALTFAVLAHFSLWGLSTTWGMLSVFYWLLKRNSLQSRTDTVRREMEKSFK
jgi:glycosyltransferase 2 family protein